MRAFRAPTADGERAWYGAAGGRSGRGRLGRGERSRFDRFAGDCREVWLLGGMGVRKDRERQSGGERDEDFELHFLRDSEVDVFWSWGNLNANLAVVINVCT